jgi:hypothetical protein
MATPIILGFNTNQSMLTIEQREIISISSKKIQTYGLPPRIITLRYIESLYLISWEFDLS